METFEATRQLDTIVYKYELRTVLVQGVERNDAGVHVVIPASCHGIRT